MRIGINLLYLLPNLVGGTETYAAGLLWGMERLGGDHDVVVFVNRESENWPLPESGNFIRVVCPVYASNRLSRYYFEQVRLPNLLKKLEIDIIHSLGYTSPLFSSCPSLVTIHDLNYRVFGEWMSPQRRLALGFFIKYAALRASKVITVSAFSRDQIAQAFNIPLDRISVIHEAPKDRGLFELDLNKVHVLLDEHQIKLPYCLAFVSTSPNKNIPRLLQAFSKAKEQYNLSNQLVLVGHLNPKDMAGYTQQISNGDLCFTGFLDDFSLKIVLSHAQFLIFPSFYEGFGLPILEAMAAGVPVLCSNKTSLPEVAGNAAAFFDPFSIDDMIDKIHNYALNEQLRVELRRKGFANAKRFSWDKAARETLKVYEYLYNQRK